MPIFFPVCLPYFLHYFRFSFLPHSPTFCPDRPDLWSHFLPYFLPTFLYPFFPSLLSSLFVSLVSSLYPGFLYFLPCSISIVFPIVFPVSLPIFFVCSLLFPFLCSSYVLPHSLPIFFPVTGLFPLVSSLSFPIFFSRLLTIDSQEVKICPSLLGLSHFPNAFDGPKLGYVPHVPLTYHPLKIHALPLQSGCFEVSPVSPVFPVSPIAWQAHLGWLLKRLGRWVHLSWDPNRMLGRPKRIEKGRWYRNLAKKCHLSGVYGIWRGQQNVMVHINQNGELKHCITKNWGLQYTYRNKIGVLKHLRFRPSCLHLKDRQNGALFPSAIFLTSWRNEATWDMQGFPANDRDVQNTAVWPNSMHLKSYLRRESWLLWISPNPKK